ncbi:hypothetical protein V8G54_031588 [Vigna mungo]|uniref:Rubisco LSMT substrate-binding domain-containing protein n=1 Tax=Vigna mungo TaxID=3915 RepID=A0AAQ3RI23_VIGMU
MVKDVVWYRNAAIRSPAMPLRALTVTASLRRCLRCLHLSFCSFSLSKHQFSANCPEFLPWLERKADSAVSSSLFIGKSSYGRFVFLVSVCFQDNTNWRLHFKGSLQSGMLRILSCARMLYYATTTYTCRNDRLLLTQITADNLPPEIKSLIGEEVGNIAKLAIVILIEKKMGQGSEWYPYISRLPQQGEQHNTVFWNESELELIRPSSVYQETIDHKSQIEKDFLTIKRTNNAQKFDLSLSLSPFFFPLFVPLRMVWGYILVYLQEKSLKIIADRDYAPGEQVLIRYGKFSNATLLLDFGFSIPYNIYDQLSLIDNGNNSQVKVQFDVPKHDPLHDMKLELLQRNIVPHPEDMEDLTYPANTFSIKEVKSDKGKGKGLPQSLRALARVLSCTTSQELDDLVEEAAQNDGRLARRPLKDISKEIQAHLMLLSVFIQLIEERNAIIMSLGSCHRPLLCERLAVRRIMAEDLLHGELRILKSASAWLENYCVSLT